MGDNGAGNNDVEDNDAEDNELPDYSEDLVAKLRHKADDLPKKCSSKATLYSSQEMSPKNLTRKSEYHKYISNDSPILSLPFS